jgi:hypothetical protein
VSDPIAKLLGDSAQIIAGWEAIGVPTGRAEDNLRIIREHMIKLAEVSTAMPHLADEVETLAMRYGAMATRIRLRAN